MREVAGLPCLRYVPVTEDLHAMSNLGLTAEEGDQDKFVQKGSAFLAYATYQ